MRIQETDRILKESRVSRHAQAMHDESHGGMLTRVWRSLSGLPTKLTGMFRHS